MTAPETPAIFTARFVLGLTAWACSVCVGTLAVLFGWDRVREAARYKERDH